MGSLCSKASSDNFAGQGRPVGSAPAPAGTASVPKTVKAAAPKVGGPPRTLGGGASAGQAGGAADDARSKAAAAAEVCLDYSPPLCRPTTLLRRPATPSNPAAFAILPRLIPASVSSRPRLTHSQARAQASKPTGKLGAKLEAQKKMTRNEALQAASSDEQRARDLDASASALRHD